MFVCESVFMCVYTCACRYVGDRTNSCAAEAIFMYAMEDSISRLFQIAVYHTVVQ